MFGQVSYGRRGRGVAINLTSRWKASRRAPGGAVPVKAGKIGAAAFISSAGTMALAEAGTRQRATRG